MLLTYPVFVVEEMAAAILIVVVTYLVVIRLGMPIYYIIPIISAVSVLSVVVQNQAHGQVINPYIIYIRMHLLHGNGIRIFLIIRKIME